MRRAWEDIRFGDGQCVVMPMLVKELRVADFETGCTVELLYGLVVIVLQISMVSS